MSCNSFRNVSDVVFMVYNLYRIRLWQLETSLARPQSLLKYPWCWSKHQTSKGHWIPKSTVTFYLLTKWPVKNRPAWRVSNALKNICSLRSPIEIPPDSAEWFCNIYRWRNNSRLNDVTPQKCQWCSSHRIICIVVVSLWSPITHKKIKAQCWAKAFRYLQLK